MAFLDDLLYNCTCSTVTNNPLVVQSYSSLLFIVIFTRPSIMPFVAKSVELLVSHLEIHNTQRVFFKRTFCLSNFYRYHNSF